MKRKLFSHWYKVQRHTPKYWKAFIEKRQNDILNFQADIEQMTRFKSSLSPDSQKSIISNLDFHIQNNKRSILFALCDIEGTELILKDRNREYVIYPDEYTWPDSSGIKEARVERRIV